MKKMAFVLGLLIASVAVADDRSAKIERLMEAQGLKAIFEQQMEWGKQQGREQGKKLLVQIMENYNPSPEYRQRLEEAFQAFLADLQSPWSSAEVVDVWARFYGKHFSDDELDQLLAFYTSSLGQKEVQASKEALVEYSNYFAEAGKPIAEKALKTYMDRLQQISKECQCNKIQPSNKPAKLAPHLRGS